MMKIKTRPAAGALVLLMMAAPATAEIYKYVDQDGRTTYTNIPVKGAKAVDLDPVNTVSPSQKPRPSGSTGQGGSASRLATPPSYPAVDSQTQKRRDDMRLSILREELNNEQELLAKARKELEEAESVRLGSERNYQRYLDRVQPFKDTVSLHEENIKALQAEISNLQR